MHEAILTLGLPHTNRWGLAEHLLLMHAGHIHWTALAHTILSECDPDRVLGVDSSAGFIDYALSHVRSPRVSFKVGDASKCDHLADASFDKACSVDVIEHCGHDVMLDQPERLG